MRALRSAFLEGLHLGARVMSDGREDINPHTAEVAWNVSDAKLARDRDATMSLGPTVAVRFAGGMVGGFALGRLLARIVALRDSNRHAQRGDAFAAPSEGCQSGRSEAEASPK